MKEYIKNFREIYKINNIMKYSIVINILLLFVDENNLPSKLNISKFYLIIYVFVGIFILLNLSELNLFNTLKIKIVNDIDAILLCSITSIIIYLISSYMLICSITYRIYIGGGILLLLFIILIRRMIIFSKGIKNIQSNSNIYSLKDLYNGQIEEGKELILIDEESVDYDLLDRGIFINNLYDIITECNPNKNL